MARLKSDCVKWTLVLVLSVFSHYVFSLPQNESASIDAVPNVGTEKPTEDLTRYTYKQNNDSYFFFQLPFNNSVNKVSLNVNINNKGLHDDVYDVNNNLNETKLNINEGERVGRVVRKKHKIRPNYNTQKETNENKISAFNNKVQTQSNDRLLISKNVNKPVIKKIITKWTDKTKYDDLNVSEENNESDERDSSNFVNVLNSDINFSSTENAYNSYESTVHSTKQSNDKRITYSYNRPQYSEESQVYSNNFQVIDHPYVTRPNYVFTTPTPTPIITNVGYPKPWNSPQYNPPSRRPTTKKPIKTTKPEKPYIHHNSNPHYSPYPGNEFEVTTFPPLIGYTDRIVIRPEEYNAASDECPTIFLTLNNTFQGQGKEACPDLNIAVNTNVVNKNVVVESEEDTDTTLTDVFGLPLDDSGSDESSNDYAESQEDDEQTSASVEGLELSSYNAANSASEAESSETVNVASPSTALSSYNRPSRPDENDDDVFSFSSVIDFFRPAISAFSWLAAINPLSFSALSFLLTPLILLFAGTSGLFALFSPWAAREAPEVYFYTPQWQWDDYYKTWYLHSFPNSRTLQVENPRSSTESSNVNVDRSTWLYKVKELLKAVTKSIRDKQRVGLVNNDRKNKRKKRETWTIRVK